ncbi:conserved hypothetical protein [Microscilla marina ATCC 23134]|uniref:SiaC family regulatory phosphoprotein domain-containing protein n=2 Tax=Microscilla marina TaxID=1027 RepID=A1ZUJ9_MICM2|nr:conserved hypothetical protein [Microscilla marina ATCC 23134]
MWMKYYTKQQIVMQNRFFMQEGEHTPCIDFNLETMTFRIEGSSFVEFPSVIYSKAINWLEAFLKSPPISSLQLTLKLSYFNTKFRYVLFDIFTVLSQKQVKAIINWYITPDITDSKEDGEFFHECFPELEFHFIESHATR